MDFYFLSINLSKSEFFRMNTSFNYSERSFNDDMRFGTHRSSSVYERPRSSHLLTAPPPAQRLSVNLLLFRGFVLFVLLFPYWSLALVAVCTYCLY